MYYKLNLWNYWHLLAEKISVPFFELTVVTDVWPSWGLLLVPVAKISYFSTTPRLWVIFHLLTRKIIFFWVDICVTNVWATCGLMLVLVAHDCNSCDDGNARQGWYVRILCCNLYWIEKHVVKSSGLPTIILVRIKAFSGWKNILPLFSIIGRSSSSPFS